MIKYGHIIAPKRPVTKTPAEAMEPYPPRLSARGIAIAVVTDFGTMDFVTASSIPKSLHKIKTLPTETITPTIQPDRIGIKFFLISSRLLYIENASAAVERGRKVSITFPPLSKLETGIPKE